MYIIEGNKAQEDSLTLNISDDIITSEYETLKSSYKVAIKLNISRNRVIRVLKRLGVLRTQSQAAKDRDFKIPVYTRTRDHRLNLSNLAKKRTGEKNPFFGKSHSQESKNKIGNHTKLRVGKRNPNYKEGKYFRRPRDFKYHKLKPLKNLVFNRDKHTCFYCKKIGGHLHAHHIIPYWVVNESFLDVDNMITACSDCHFSKAHLGNWSNFDTNLVTTLLMNRYNLQRERLNELTEFFNSDAKVRPTEINKTVEIDGNDLSLLKKEE
jgi:hypothetical protein